jgi:hypothetical protein
VHNSQPECQYLLPGKCYLSIGFGGIESGGWLGVDAVQVCATTFDAGVSIACSIAVAVWGFAALIAVVIATKTPSSKLDTKKREPKTHFRTDGRLH